MQYPHLFAPHEGTYWGFAVALFLAGYTLVMWRKKPPRGGWLWRRHLLLPLAVMASFAWLSVALLVVQHSEARAYTAFGEIVWASVLVVVTAYPAAMYLRKKHLGIPLLGYVGGILLHGIAISMLLQMAGLYVERPGLMQFFNGSVYLNYLFNSVLVVMWPMLKFLVWVRWIPSKLHPNAKPTPAPGK